MTNLKRAKLMIWIVVFGLFMSGVTVWPALFELKTAVRFIWGNVEATNSLHSFLLQVIEGLESTGANYPYLMYAYDWLAFAHIVLAILFAGAIRDLVRNKWIIQCGLIMCALVPILAIICIPVRGIPFYWFWIDAAFAPAAAIPLWIALRDIIKIEKESKSS
ncbi:MAG: hypothetical protein K9J13_11660 [Saprospiraceae bacterium]|nr:hypothetical protein [Saprospiraceae bacterium]